MRLLVVTHAYPRWEGDVAGAFIERLCVALSHRGHEIEVLAPADAGRGGRETRAGVSVERVRYARAEDEVLAYRGTMATAARSLRGLRAFAGLVGGFRRAIVGRGRGGRCDLVHAHWWVPAGLAAWRAAPRSRLPYVVSVHGTDVTILARSGVARFFARRVLRAAARVTAASQYLATEVARPCGLDPSSILVQPMPTIVTEPDLPVRPPGSPSGSLRLLTVGRLTKQKRVHLVLETVRDLVARGAAVRCTIAGDGPERGALERMAVALGAADRVAFVGAIAPDQVPAYLADADVFMFPAEREGFGLVVAEALIHGVPVVVCTDGGGARDMVTDGGGRVVAPEPAVLGAAALAVARDATIRAAAARAGAVWRRRLAPETVARHVEEMAQVALGGPVV